MKRHFVFLPFLGIAVFVCAYFYAASLYPGSTFGHHETIGYSHLHNFWCDLIDRVTYAGVPNPSRWIAELGMIALLFSLLSYWYYLPFLFGPSRWKARVVRVCGCTAMFVGLFLPFAHDIVINTAFAFALVAFPAALIGLVQNREYKIFAVAAIAILFCLISFVMWRARFDLELLPTVQKLTFLSFFTWI